MYFVGANAIYFLSAKHGLLSLTDQIPPYEQSLIKMKRPERKAWGEMVIGQLTSVCNPAMDEMIILAGHAYSAPLLVECKTETF